MRNLLIASGCALLVGCATLSQLKNTVVDSHVVASVQCVRGDERLRTIYTDYPAAIAWLDTKLASMRGVGAQLLAGQFSLTQEQAVQYLDTMDVMERAKVCLQAGAPGDDAGAARMEAMKP